jgi:hypothetical protein
MSILNQCRNRVAMLKRLCILVVVMGVISSVTAAKTYWDNGNIRGEYSINAAGQLDGIYKAYYESGMLKTEGKYKDGKKIGLWTYYDENGIETKKESHTLKRNISGVEQRLKNFETGVFAADRVIKQKSIAVGVLQLGAGIIGGIFTIYDANRKYSIPSGSDEIEVKSEWVPIHTVCITLSASMLITGIIDLAAANR